MLEIGDHSRKEGCNWRVWRLLFSTFSLLLIAFCLCEVKTSSACLSNTLLTAEGPVFPNPHSEK